MTATRSTSRRRRAGPRGSVSSRVACGARASSFLASGRRVGRHVRVPVSGVDRDEHHLPAASRPRAGAGRSMAPASSRAGTHRPLPSAARQTSSLDARVRAGPPCVQASAIAAASTRDTKRASSRGSACSGRTVLGFGTHGDVEAPDLPARRTRRPTRPRAPARSAAHRGLAHELVARWRARAQTERGRRRRRARRTGGAGSAAPRRPAAAGPGGAAGGGRSARRLAARAPVVLGATARLGSGSGRPR